MKKYILGCLIFLVGCTPEHTSIKIVDRTVRSEILFAGNIIVATDGSTTRSALWYTRGTELEAVWKEPITAEKVK